jgi:DNA-binding transcriptional LysR family regulator
MDPTYLHSQADPLATSFATTYAGVVAFIAVVAEGSFARAADRLGVGRSAVSRNVQKLEEQLNVRLLQRTTRSTSLTREGDLFYANCHKGVDRIVQAVEEMKDLRNGPPRGHLRVATTAGFGRKVVAPLLHEFLEIYDGVTVDLLLVDRDVDLTSDRIDIEFRHGRMEDSQIIAKRIMPMDMWVCASPAYAESHGMPSSIEDVLTHDCINFRCGSGRVAEWEFKTEGGTRRILPEAKVTYNDPELVLQAALDGQGLAQMPGYLVDKHLEQGGLVPCLESYAMDDRGHYICYQSRQHMPTRMRVFIDFVTERIRASHVR